MEYSEDDKSMMTEFVPDSTDCVIFSASPRVGVPMGGECSSRTSWNSLCRQKAPTELLETI